MELTINTLTKLTGLFQYMHWEIVEDQEKWASLFNRYSARLSIFNEEQQNLIIELSYRFKNIGLNDYEEHFLKALEKIENIKEYKKILIAPLKNPSDTSTKSGDSVWYHLKNNVDFSYNWIADKLSWESNWDKIRAVINDKVIVILVDDFTGTGNTAISALDEMYLKSIINRNDHIKVITFVGQELGINAINEKYSGIIYTDLVFKRAISDRYIKQPRELRTKIMNEIEEKLNVREDFRFGFGKSESLVSISNRSVNNTFPVFWLEKKNKLAPFKR